MATAPGRPAQARHARAAVKEDEEMGLRSLPRSGVWGVWQTAVRRHRLAAVLAVATCALAASTVLIPAAWA